MRCPQLLGLVVLLTAASTSQAQTDPPADPAVVALSEDSTVSRTTQKYGKDGPFIPLWPRTKRFGLDLTLIQPGSFFFDDSGEDDPGEIDLFHDGKLAISVQLAGVDLGYRIQANAVRFGFNGGTGISTATISEHCRARDAEGTCTDNVAATTGAVLVLNGGVFVQFRDLMRFEVGRIKGISGVETATGSQRTDGGRYFGVSFNTKIGDSLENLIRGEPEKSDGEKPAPAANASKPR
jgi:hypothetical protein